MAGGRAGAGWPLCLMLSGRSVVFALRARALHIHSFIHSFFEFNITPGTEKAALEQMGILAFRKIPF